MVKLLSEEIESATLEAWLASRPGVPRFTSDLSKVEVVRACRRFDERIVPEARRLLSGLYVIPLNAGLLERAGTFGAPILRSLDAIHLVSAISLGTELSAFVTYDRRLRVAADEERLPVVAPA